MPFFRSLFKSRRKDAEKDKDSASSETPPELRLVPASDQNLAAVVSSNSSRPALPHDATLTLAIEPGPSSGFEMIYELSWGGDKKNLGFNAGAGALLGPFIYRPLQGPTSTRLLTLLPSTSWDAPIEIELTEVDLSSKPDYDALSYAWGDTNDRVGISCHNRRLDVTVNCALALQHLRGEKPRQLWVDAICIDQGNTPERNQQVRIMGSVYETAETVIVWLGPRRKSSDLALAMLKSLEDVIDEDPIVQNRFARSMYPKQDLSRPKDGDGLFSELARRSWFRRLWTLQEIALARKVVVVCGRWSIPWETLTAALKIIRQIESEDGRFGTISAFEYTLGGRQLVIAALAARSDGKESSASSNNIDRPVSAIFTQGLFYKCRFPQDHVFGIYALLQKLGAQLPNPDYERPVDQIFAEAARLAIEHDNKLHILSFVNAIEERDNWPSWVPTWYEKMGPKPLDERFFHATKDSQPMFSFSLDSRCLTVKAKIIDTIFLKAEKSPLLGEPNLDDFDNIEAAAVIESDIKSVQAYHEWMILLHTWMMLFSRMVPRRYGDQDDLLLAFMRVLLQDFSAVPEIPPEMYETVLSGYSNWQQLLSALNPDSSTPIPVIEQLLEPEDLTADGLPADKRHLVQTDEWKISRAMRRDEQASRFGWNVDLACKCQVLFFTSGGFMGKASGAVRRGDAVALISGLQIPVIVRQIRQAQDGANVSRREYRFLGPAYVLGLMQGEIWPYIENELEDIVLV